MKPTELEYLRACLLVSFSDAMDRVANKGKGKTEFDFPIIQNVRGMLRKGPNGAPSGIDHASTEQIQEFTRQLDAILA